MKKTISDEWTRRPETIRVLLWFLFARTPKGVEKQLGLRKLKMKPFVEKGLLKCVNPLARKGRFYVASAKARRLVGLPASKRAIDKKWDLIGWVKAGPRGRLIVLCSMESAKRTSENIRERASRSNASLTRISVKGILKQLIEKRLVQSEVDERKRRRYWITERGTRMINDLDHVIANKNRESFQGSHLV